MRLKNLELRLNNMGNRIYLGLPTKNGARFKEVPEPKDVTKQVYRAVLSFLLKNDVEWYFQSDGRMYRLQAVPLNE